VARSRLRVWLIIFAVPVLLVLGALGYLAWRQSVPPVRVEFQPVPQFIGARTPITLVLRASRGKGGQRQEVVRLPAGYLDARDDDRPPAPLDAGWERGLDGG